MDKPRYWAFLSYSHADRDWARWLHRSLESYGVPRRLVARQTSVGLSPRRFSPIFRDREELTADARLGDRIEEALAGSAYLIVLCSPAAARSAWVDREIARFKVLHGEDRVLAVIVDGEHYASGGIGEHADECFPAALRFRVAADGSLSDERAEPIAADLRPGKDGKRLARLKLLARMLEVGLDELARRDAQRRQAQLAALAATASIVALGMGALAVAAVIARNEARVERSQAEGLVEFMIGDLQKKLEPKVKLDVLGAIADRAMAYYSVQAHHGMDDDALARRSRALTELGEIEHDRGDLAGELKFMHQASGVAKQLLAREPDNPSRIVDYAHIVNGLAEAAYDRHDIAAADAGMREYLGLAQHLVITAGRKDDWLAELAQAQVNVGTIMLQQHKLDEALGVLQGAVATRRELAARTPGSWQLNFDLANALAWLSDAERLSGRDVDALRDRQAEDAVLGILLKRSVDDQQASDDLVTSQATQAHLRLGLGQVDLARGLAEAATTRAERLLLADSSNTDFGTDAVGSYVALGEAELAGGNAGPADRAAARALKLLEGLIAKDPTVMQWTGPYLGNARLLRVRAQARGASNSESCRRALKPALAESRRLDGLLALSPDSTSLALAAARGDLLRGDAQAMDGRTAVARLSWTKGLEGLHRASGGVMPRDRASLDVARELSARNGVRIAVEWDTCGQVYRVDKS